MALRKVVSGITSLEFNNILNENFEQLFPILKNTQDPTSSTFGNVGQEYLNTESGMLFICVSNENNLYSWVKVEDTTLYPVIIGDIAPTMETVAMGVSQQYLNITDNSYYICVSIEGQNYTWVMINNNYILSTIVRNETPTTSTPSDGIGQLYFDTLQNNLYICVFIDYENSNYTWSLLTNNNSTDQIITSELQPSSQRVNDYWFQITKRSII